MTDQFLAEIRIFPFTFAPQGWAFCNGQILPISSNTALFSLLGTNFGGDGRSNFGLPNLMGAAPLHVGGSAGPGLSPYVVGEETGTSTVTLLTSQLPAHGHTLSATSAAGTTATAAGSQLAFGHGGTKQNSYNANFYSGNKAQTPLNPLAIGVTGSSAAHNNMMPYLTLNFCIALQGIYPPRS